jgi:hypothetical protein
MKKIILLCVIGVLLSLGGFIIGVRTGYAEADSYNKFRVTYLDAAYALTNYTVHNEVLKKLEAQDVSSAISFTKDIVDSNKSTVEKCLNVSDCKKIIETEITLHAPEFLNNKASKEELNE